MTSGLPTALEIQDILAFHTDAGDKYFLQLEEETKVQNS